MTTISCADCPWGDARPSTNSPLHICDNCGGNRLAFAEQAVDVPPAPQPAPVQPIA